MLSSPGAEHSGTCKSVVEYSNNICLDYRLSETMTWEVRLPNSGTQNRTEVSLQFQVPESKIVKQLDKNHLSEVEGTIHNNDM